MTHPAAPLSDDTQQYPDLPLDAYLARQAQPGVDLRPRQVRDLLALLLILGGFVITAGMLWTVDPRLAVGVTGVAMVVVGVMLGYEPR